MEPWARDSGPGALCYARESVRLRRIAMAIHPAFALMVVGIGWLVFTGELLARSNLARAIQAAAVVLMIAARVTFGRRSFHAAANTTEGGLVTHGPTCCGAPSDLLGHSLFHVEHGN